MLLTHVLLCVRHGGGAEPMGAGAPMVQVSAQDQPSVSPQDSTAQPPNPSTCLAANPTACHQIGLPPAPAPDDVQNGAGAVLRARLHEGLHNACMECVTALSVGGLGAGASCGWQATQGGT